MTSNVISTAGIVGTDGKTPIYNPDARFQVWSKKELYTGGIGENRYVPKVDDLVIDMDLFIHYIVTDIDAATLIPTLRELTKINSDGEMSTDDLLLGVGPGTQSDTYRIYIDKTVMPYTLAVDARLKIAGSMANSAKIFKGADLTDQGTVISAFYDNMGTLLGTSIPLELVSLPGGQTNYAVKTVPVCYTMQDLQDGELVTVVVYSPAGHVVSKRQLLVENTSFIRQANTGVKYVTGISLECPFLSETTPRLINLPLNVMLDGLNLVGVVHYSDGTRNKMPVDGTRFSVLGIDNFISTIVDQQVPIVLRYQLSNSEAAYGVQVGDNHYITETYRIKTTNVEGSYSVKLFCYPVWVNAVEGYTLRWYLYNGDRQVVYNVTGLVEWSATSPAFNPISYGVNQRLTVAINLSNVNGSYNNYRHVQTFEIVLWNQGTERTTNWTIAFEPGQVPPFGENNHASLRFVNYNYWVLKVDSGCANQTEWLDRLYYRTKPLIDPTKEQTPPAPTHYRIRYGSQDYEFPISQWNQEAIVSNGLSDSGTLFIEFIRRTPETDLQLAVCGMPIYQTT